ncbi:Protein-tyrosine phosphatase, low molecular weight, partial [mine drainage metagenome]
MHERVRAECRVPPPGTWDPSDGRRIPMTQPEVVLFLCVGNSARSLMAEAMFNADPPTGWTATSAGTRPAPAAHPRTGPMLREIGLDLPPHPPRQLTPEMIDRARLRITMGCRDDAACPARLAAVEVRDWALPDPVPLDDHGFRAVRDRLAGLVRDLRTELALAGRPRTGLVRPPRSDRRDGSSGAPPHDPAASPAAAEAPRSPGESGSTVPGPSGQLDVV